MDIYKYKYLKYKHKYLNIKNVNMKGGFNFINTTKFYILVKITNQYISDRLDERRKILLKGNLPLQTVLHLTLIQMELNQDNPDVKILEEKSFFDTVKNAYINSLKKNNVILSSQFGQYDLLGSGNNQFFVKAYDSDQPLEISNFRTAIYQYIQSKLGPANITKKKINNIEYYVFSYKNNELFTVPEFYYGKGKWVPHVSILNTGDIQKYNPELYNSYLQQQTKNQKLLKLFTPIVEAQFKPIGKINMNTDTKELVMSFKNAKSKIDKDYKIKI